MQRALSNRGNPAHDYTFETVMRYMHEMLCGIKALHELHLLHGRLCLRNTLLTMDDRVRLSDYGVSSSSTIRWRLPEDSVPLFLAPERRRGGSLTPTSDSYSLGICGYMLVTRSFEVEEQVAEGLAPLDISFPDDPDLPRK